MRILGALGIILIGVSSATAESRDLVSFRNDVLTVLSKSGCNAGACHGAQTGKGELHLSLRGERPAEDFATLTKWANREKPEQSLILRKPTLDLDHEGGERFAAGSESYQILRNWIARGAKDDPEDTPTLVSLAVEPREQVVFEPEHEVQLKVTAKWSDGEARDVTRWAIYEPSNLIVEVSPDGRVRALKAGETTVSVRFHGQQLPTRLLFVATKPDFVWSAPQPANFIDERIYEKLKLIRANPSGICDDSTFVRRAHLDLIGLTPTADEARAFADSADPDKRAKLIDELLERDEFADFWALKWADLLRVEEKLMDTSGVAKFHDFIRLSIAENKPIDRFAREILRARGSTYHNPASNYYRALRDPASRAEAVAQVFLGTRLGCAKCHNHPYENWTQDDYYGFAAAFDGIDYRIVKNDRKDKNDRAQFIGEQIVLVNAPMGFKDPRTNQAPHPRLLDASEFDEGDRLEKLGAWVTSAENPLFSRVQINRIWFQLMGRGLVDPVDDFRATNPASHPELLDELAARFAESGFDLRAAIRLIMASKAYQFSAEPDSTNETDVTNFSHAETRRLTAEQLLDSLHAVLEVPAKFNGYDESIRAAQLAGVNKVYRDGHPSPDDLFVKLFGKPMRLTNSDSERREETSLAQVFELISGEALEQLLAAPDNRIGRLLGTEAGDAAILDELYWAALSRAPTTAESEAMLEHVSKAGSRRAGFEDIAWSVLNSKEFLLRR